MDSSPKPSPEEIIAHLPDFVRERVADAIPVVLPGLETSLAETAQHFLESEKRLTEGITLVAGLEAPGDKKMGMAVSALLLRARELAARWRAFEPSIEGLKAVWTPPRELLFPEALLARRSDIEPLPLAVPEWEIPQGDWLRDRCEAMVYGWFNSGRLAIAITSVEKTECRLAFLIQIADEFRRESWPALGGEDGLLKGLPELHEQISGSIFREEFLSDG